MRLSAFFAALLLAASLNVPAFASPFETPKALLENLYKVNETAAAEDGEATDDNQFPYQPYLSDHLLSLFQAERAKSPDEPSNLDWDPVIAGQDGEATKVRIGKAVIKGDRATVKVNFVNFEPVELIYTLVNEHGGWKIDDIEKKTGEFPWKVSKQITAN